MPFQVHPERLPQYLHLRVSGPASLKNYFDLIDESARRTLADGIGRVLCDLRGVAGRLSFTDQFFIGDVIGQKLQHLEKIASLVASDPDSYNSPKVAKRMGLDLRSFDSEAKAIAWLLE
jgi:hypothetical protein